MNMTAPTTRIDPFGEEAARRACAALGIQCQPGIEPFFAANRIEWLDLDTFSFPDDDEVLGSTPTEVIETLRRHEIPLHLPAGLIIVGITHPDTGQHLYTIISVHQHDPTAARPIAPGWRLLRKDGRIVVQHDDGSGYSAGDDPDNIASAILYRLAHDLLATTNTEHCPFLERSADMPPGAIEWRKTAGGHCFFVSKVTLRSSEHDAQVPCTTAPDYLPDVQGPCFRIITPPESPTNAR